MPHVRHLPTMHLTTMHLGLTAQAIGRHRRKAAPGAEHESRGEQDGKGKAEGAKHGRIIGARNWNASPTIRTGLRQGYAARSISTPIALHRERLLPGFSRFRELR